MILVSVPLVGLCFALACAGPASSPSRPTGDPARYRLSDSGEEWRRSGDDEVLADLEPRYPDFFAEVLDPGWQEDFDIMQVRDDLESGEPGRPPFDALNAVAVAYFELNARAQRGLRDESGGAHYLTDSFRAAKLLSIPWRAYRDVDPRLRDAILDFFADIARGEKREAGATATRITRTVESLAKKEDDPGRLARIRDLSARLRQLEAELP